MSLLIRERNQRLTERYGVLSERYRQRGWDPPALPTGGLEAMNVVQEMVARINGREPLRIRVNTVTPTPPVKEPE